MNIATETLHTEIYSRLTESNRLELLSDLNPKQKSGYLELDCPSCNEYGAAYLHDNGFEIHCNRKNNCGQVMTIIDYVINKEGFKTFYEGFQSLAKTVSYPLPKLDEKEIQKLEVLQTSEKIINEVFSFFRDQLFSKFGERSIEHLEYRGYSPDDINLMPIGHNPGFDRTILHMKEKGYESDDITKALNFIKARDNYPIVFPYHDYNGRILSLWGRTLDPNEKDKYKPFGQTGKTSPFYLNKARKSKEIVIVEGYFDAMIAHARNLTNVVSVGGSELTKAQLSIIKQLGINRVYLALDHDKTGTEGTEKTINLLHQNDIEVFVVNYPNEYKDPDQYITQTKDIIFFKEDIKKAVSGSKWLIDHIANKHAITEDVGKQNARNEVFSFGNQIKNEITFADFVNHIPASLEIPREHINQLIAEFKENAKKEELGKAQNKIAEEYASTIKLLADEEKYDEILKLQKPSPINTESNLDKFLEINTEEKMLEGFKHFIPSFSTGYKIGELELEFPCGAITIIAAPTSHGKTSSMINFGLSTLDKNNDSKIAYFSFEEDWLFIQSKFLNTHLNEKISSNNLKSIISFFRDETTEFVATCKREDFLNKKNKFFEDLINKPRLRIFGLSSMNVKDIIDIIKLLKDKAKINMVFIDYIQLLRSETKNGTPKGEELRDVCEALNNCAIETGLAIVAAAQFNRNVKSKEDLVLHNLADASSIEKFTSLALGMWNYKFDEKPKDEIHFRVMKGRNVGMGYSCDMGFDGNKSKLTQIPDTIDPKPIDDAGKMGKEFIEQQKLLENKDSKTIMSYAELKKKSTKTKGR